MDEESQRLPSQGARRWITSLQWRVFFNFFFPQKREESPEQGPYVCRRQKETENKWRGTAECKKHDLRTYFSGFNFQNKSFPNRLKIDWKNSFSEVIVGTGNQCRSRRPCMLPICCCIPLLTAILQLVHWASLDFLLLFLGISIPNAFPTRTPAGPLSYRLWHRSIDSVYGIDQ